MKIYTTDITLFAAICQSEYGLECEPKFYLTDSLVFQDIDCMGLYEGFYIKGNYQHAITINRLAVDSLETLFCIIAHEYAHAYQVENNLPLDHEDNCRVFRSFSKMFKRYYDVILP